MIATKEQQRRKEIPPIESVSAAWSLTKSTAIVDTTLDWLSMVASQIESVVLYSLKRDMRLSSDTASWSASRD